MRLIGSTAKIKNIYKEQLKTKRSKISRLRFRIDVLIFVRLNYFVGLTTSRSKGLTYGPLSLFVINLTSWIRLYFSSGRLRKKN